MREAQRCRTFIVKIWPGKSEQQKQRLAEGVTKAVMTSSISPRRRRWLIPSAISRNWDVLQFSHHFSCTRRFSGADATATADYELDDPGSTTIDLLHFADAIWSCRRQ